MPNRYSGCRVRLVDIHSAAESQWLADTWGHDLLLWIGFTDEALEGAWV